MKKMVLFSLVLTSLVVAGDKTPEMPRKPMNILVTQTPPRPGQEEKAREVLKALHQQKAAMKSSPKKASNKENAALRGLPKTGSSKDIIAAYEEREDFNL